MAWATSWRARRRSARENVAPGAAGARRPPRMRVTREANLIVKSGEIGDQADRPARRTRATWKIVRARRFHVWGGEGSQALMIFSGECPSGRSRFGGRHPVRGVRERRFQLDVLGVGGR